MTRPRQNSPSRLQVALIIESSLASGRKILEGIAQYVREHGTWSLYFAPRNVDTALPGWLRRWKGDGIIARVQDRRIAGGLKKTGLPVVDVWGRVAEGAFPLVHVDNAAIARLAADHLLERGFKNFGCCALADVNWSEQRSAAFVRAVRVWGHGCPVHWLPDYLSPESSWAKEQERLTRWLRRLEKPAGVFAVNDDMGLRVLDACRRGGISLPDQLAVVGADNDEVICRLGDPSLSSVAAGHARVGYEAARLLTALVRGRAAPNGPLLIAPTKVVTRASSDVLMIEDPLVAEALRVVRQRACRGARVGDVADEIGASRTTLKRRFRQVLKRSVHEEIVAVQLKEAQSLLAETDLPLKQIAKRAGFSRLSYMCVAFKRLVGMPPGQYLQEHQGGQKAAALPLSHSLLVDSER